MADQENTSTQAPADSGAEDTSTNSTTEGSETQEVSGGDTQAGAQAAATIKDPKAPKAAKVQAEKQLKKLKLKVDGEEFEEEYDPNDEEYMTRQFQLAKVAQKRMNDFASLQKEVINFVKELKTNPRRALSDPNIGLDVKQLAAQIIEEEIAQSKKSPEQIEKEKLQAELQAMKEEREREKQTAQQKEYERLVAQTEEHYDIQIDKALQNTDLPKEDYVVKKIADYLYVGLKAGKDITVEDVMPLVREEIINDLNHLINALPDDQLDKFVGKTIQDRMRKKNIAKATKAKSAPGSSKALDVAKKSGNDGKKAAPKKTFKDFFGM